jgi:hypothetical protein
MGETFTGLRIRPFGRLLKVVRERGGNGLRAAWVYTKAAGQTGAGRT